MARRATVEDASAAYAVSDTDKAAAAAGAPINTTAAAVDENHIAGDMSGERRTTTAAATAPMVQATAATVTHVKSRAKVSGLQNDK